MLTFRLAVVHSLPSAMRLESAIVPERFWSFPERCDERKQRTSPNAMISATVTTPIRVPLILSSPSRVIGHCVFAPVTQPTTHSSRDAALAIYVPGGDGSPLRDH